MPTGQKPGQAHNSPHPGICEFCGNQPAPTFHPLLLFCVEILGKNNISFFLQKRKLEFSDLPVEAKWGLPACVCVCLGLLALLLAARGGR